MSQESVLIMIAHPDDEAIYFTQGILNLRIKYNVDVACATYNRESVRGSEFAKSCKELGVNALYLECSDPGFYSLIPDLPDKTYRLLRSSKYRTVITHSPDGGEKPHPHHIQLHIICRYFTRELNITFKFFSEKIEIPVMRKTNFSKYFINYIKALMLLKISTVNKMLLIDIALKAIYLNLKDNKLFTVEHIFSVDKEMKKRCLIAHESQKEVITLYCTRNNSYEYLWY